MTSQQAADLLLSEYQAAKFRLAVVRSDALFGFFQAEKLNGADSLTANERAHEYAKYLDSTDYERELQVIRDCMERTS